MNFLDTLRKRICGPTGTYKLLERKGVVSAGRRPTHVEHFSFSVPFERSSWAYRNEDLARAKFIRAAICTPAVSHTDGWYFAQLWLLPPPGDSTLTPTLVAEAAATQAGEPERIVTETAFNRSYAPPEYLSRVQADAEAAQYAFLQELRGMR